MDLKKISEISAIAVPPLILCSCIRLVTYYDHWHVPILDYLSPSELLFSFIHPALIIVGLAAIYLGGSMLFAGVVLLLMKLGIVGKQKKVSKVETNVANEVSKKKKLNKSETVVSVLFILCYLGIMIYVFVQGIWFEYKIVPVVLFHVLLCFAAILTVHSLSESKEKKASIESILIGSIITLFSASFFYGRYQMHHTSTQPTPHILTLTDGSKIATTQNLIYLGKTNNYYFLYDSLGKQSTIIPANEVRTVNIKRNN